MNPLIQLEKICLVCVAVLAGFALSPPARAVCQQGCGGSNGNTFLGDNALVSTTGVADTAIGYQALLSNTNGSWNTAVGANALQLNTTGIGNTATGLGALQINDNGSNNRPTVMVRSQKT
jgi:hypothetical protein